MQNYGILEKYNNMFIYKTAFLNQLIKSSLILFTACNWSIWSMLSLCIYYDLYADISKRSFFGLSSSGGCVISPNTMVTPSVYLSLAVNSLNELIRASSALFGLTLIIAT